MLLYMIIFIIARMVKVGANKQFSNKVVSEELLIKNEK